MISGIWPIMIIYRAVAVAGAPASFFWRVEWLEKIDGSQTRFLLEAMS
jgi:hypothetical protein